jgi:hypothetical protein
MSGAAVRRAKAVAAESTKPPFFNRIVALIADAVHGAFLLCEEGSQTRCRKQNTAERMSFTLTVLAGMTRIDL